MRVDDILSRRSIRRYTDRPVPEAMLRRALEAAMAAPSAWHCDPWRYIVLTDRAALDDLAEILPYGKMLRQARAAFIACGEPEAACAKSLSYMLQDVSASVENLLLALHAQGLGAVWLGIHPNKDRIAGVSRRFGLPEGIVPVAAVAVGWPDEQPEPRTRFDSSKVHTDRW